MNKIEILNIAFIKIGEPTIVSNTENNLRTNTINAIYDHQKMFCLRLHNWNFALFNVSLYNPILVDGTNTFQFPSDYLKLVSVDNEYTIYDNKIYSSADTLNITYLKSNINENLFSPEFIEVFSIKLALELLIKLNDDEHKRNLLENAFISTLENARYTDSSENTLVKEKYGSYINSRL